MKVDQLKNKRKTEEVRLFILNRINECSEDLPKDVVKTFGISKQAVSKNLKALVDAGLIEEGRIDGKRKKYRLKTIFERRFIIDIVANTEENEVWLQDISPNIPDIKSNVRELLHHGFTEMMNNVIDHSGSSQVHIRIFRNAVVVGFSLRDHGVGIWKKLQQQCHLSDSRHAILELAKGKLTTDPQKHSGEGIFFTSRMADFFTIQSDDLIYCCSQSDGNWLFDVKKDNPIEGTQVYMEVRMDSEKTTQEVFDKFSSEYDDYGFSKTQLSIQLAKYEGDHLVSRSQAKRILSRLQQFKEVGLDFRGITQIGQAFADEIFRVFRNEHPEIRLFWINAEPEVEKMILRAIAEPSVNAQADLPL